MHPQTGSVESFLSRHVLWCIAFRMNFSGGYAGGAAPVPIPNTEVKPSRADGTAGATLWESRTLPGFDSRGRPVAGPIFFGNQRT